MRPVWPSQRRRLRSMRRARPSSGTSIRAPRSRWACQPRTTASASGRSAGEGGTPRPSAALTASRAVWGSGHTATAMSRPLPSNPVVAPPSTSSSASTASGPTAAPAGGRSHANTGCPPTATPVGLTTSAAPGASTTNATAKAVAASLPTSTTATAGPPPAATAHTCCTASPSGTFMRVSTTAPAPTSRWRTAVSCDARCQRSDAPTHQSRVHPPKPGRTNPRASTSPQPGAPNTSRGLLIERGV